MIAQFIDDWFQELGIKVNAAGHDGGNADDRCSRPRRGGPPGKANFDMFIWDWVGRGPNTSLLKIFACDEIGASSDSLWSNAQYDALYDQQHGRPHQPRSRKALLDQMQQDVL